MNKFYTGVLLIAFFACGCFNSSRQGVGTEDLARKRQVKKLKYLDANLKPGMTLKELSYILNKKWEVSPDDIFYVNASGSPYFKRKNSGDGQIGITIEAESAWSSGLFLRLNKSLSDKEFYELIKPGSGSEEVKIIEFKSFEITPDKQKAFYDKYGTVDENTEVEE